MTWSLCLRTRSGARRVRAATGLALATATMVGISLSPVGATLASAATSVSGVTAGVNPTTAGAGTATYTITFTTSSSGALTAGNTVTVLTPSGTALPSYPTGYSITAASKSVPVSSVVPSSQSGSTTLNQVVITLGGSGTQIANSTSATLVVHPTGNPIKASTADHLSVSTTADATAASSAAYTITAGPPAAFITPKGDSQSTPAGAAFTTPLGLTVVDAYGNPVAGAAVTFTAPAATVPPTPSGTFDHSNSSPCSSTAPSNPPPSNVCVVSSDSSGKAIASTFTADTAAGGPYTVAATSPGLTTYNFHLTNCSGTCPTPPTKVTPGTVAVDTTTAGANGVGYTITFTTGTAGPGPGGTITLVAPSTTGFSASAGDYSVSAPSGLIAVSSVTTSSTQGSPTSNQVVITVTPVLPITAGEMITVHVTKATGGTGMTNPTKAGFNYQIEEYTSADAQTGVFTSTYSITPGDPAAVSIFAGDGQTAFIGQSFSHPLAATVKDRFGNTVGGAQVIFTAPASGAAATWANGTNVETDTTNSTGQAETSVPVANTTPGGPYPITAAARPEFNATAATFHLTNAAQAVNPSQPVLSPSDTAGAQGVTYSLTFTTSSSGLLGSGSTISATAPAGTDFTSSTPSDYTIQVLSTSGTDTAAVSQVAPSSTTGSTTHNRVVITLDNTSSVAPGDTVTVNINGVTNPTVASDTYTITESTSADSIPATTPSYPITAGDPASISVVSGSGQTTQPGQQFASPLVVLVQDAYQNPVPGAQVTFSAPSSGASAVFADSSPTEIDLTQADGTATSSVPTANGTAGTYTVSASAASGLAANPTFSLTNAAPPPPPPPAAWSGWSGPQTSPPVGLAAGTNPAVTSWAPGRLDLFVEGGDSSLWHRWSADGGASWSGWENLGGVLVGGPGAVSWGNNRIDVMVRGSDNQLWHKWWDGSSWHGWEPLGGGLTSSPAVSSWSSGRLDVFVKGTDNAIWHKWWDGQHWGGWESLGGIGRFSPAAVSWGPGRIDLFTVGTDGGMYHQIYANGWSGWFKDLGLTFSSGPGVSSWGPGRLDLFAASSAAGNPMTHMWYGGSSWNSESLGGQLTSAPAVVSWGFQRIDTFVQGTDHNLWHQWFGQ